MGILVLKICFVIQKPLLLVGSLLVAILVWLASFVPKTTQVATSHCGDNTNHQREFEVYTGAPTMLVEEYKLLGSIFTVKVLTHNVPFLFSPEVCSHFFKAEEADMSPQEVNTKISSGIWIPSFFHCEAILKLLPNIMLNVNKQSDDKREICKVTLGLGCAVYPQLTKFS